MLRSETAAEPARTAAALRGLRAYQDAPRPAPPVPLPAVAGAGRATLRDAGGAGRPVVFVPSLINPPSVLDLTPDRSLVRWLGTQGVRSLLVDWGAPDPAERARGIADHVTDLLLPLLDALDRPPVLVGYCLGGTMGWLAAAHRPVAGVATIAAPWHFAGYPAAARQAMAALWAAARAPCDALGLVPAEVLQAAFWHLDPARTVAKYEAFGRLAPDTPAAADFVRLEDWANAGAPLTYAAGCELFALFADAGPPPPRPDVPAVEFVSVTDRIVPAATAAGLPDRREVAAGHVGMVVGSRARAHLWEPLAEWVARV
jgi:polyhydroxyalkanoate synthase subunit PhaC